MAPAKAPARRVTSPRQEEVNRSLARIILALETAKCLADDLFEEDDVRAVLLGASENSSDNLYDDLSGLAWSLERDLAMMQGRINYDVGRVLDVERVSGGFLDENENAQPSTAAEPDTEEDAEETQRQFDRAMSRLVEGLDEVECSAKDLLEIGSNALDLGKVHWSDVQSDLQAALWFGRHCSDMMRCVMDPGSSNFQKQRPDVVVAKD
jgi:hypothetical protein